MMNEEEAKKSDGDNVTIDYRSLLTWIVTALLIYGALSGLLIVFLPFSPTSQYNLVLHAVIGVLSLLPVVFLTIKHVRRRQSPEKNTGVSQSILPFVLGACLLTGLIATGQAFFGRNVSDVWRLTHLAAGAVLAVSLAAHLVPIFTRYRSVPATTRRPARRRFVASACLLIAILFAVTVLLGLSQQRAAVFTAFGDAYDWEFDEQRPFAPSRMEVNDTPWENELRASIAALLQGDEAESFASHLAASIEDGAISRSRTAIRKLALDPERQEAFDALFELAAEQQRSSGAIKAEALLGSASCGSAGCHDQIYNEWLPSAHGYSATDRLFLEVQEIAATSQSLAHTRSCGGCHDPVAVLSGARANGHGGINDLTIYEGNSCLVCHSIVSTDTRGNGGYAIEVPERYLFNGSVSRSAQWLNHFLIRSDPRHHIATYSRPLYKESEFCAACHKQVPATGTETTAGLAQEQNEYDSWLSSRWYHDDRPGETIECRECHMPLVASLDPASGDNVDSNRSSKDGMHRSHRVLGSNMYIPATSLLEGGEEQARKTIAWLRGEIEIPEIADKWTTGPVVELTIEAPDWAVAGQLIDLKLHLHNNKTGHDFPAGPLDVLESWVELTVRDNNGRTVLELGGEFSPNPIIDTPVAYKADWYDRRGLPVERHDLWEVVGASYRHVLKSGTSDMVDVAFRCPVISRPRLSGTAGESGPGERKSDVVLNIDDKDITTLEITARLLFRKANPQFLAQVFGLETNIDAPVIELVRATHTIILAAPD